MSVPAGLPGPQENRPEAPTVGMAAPVQLPTELVVRLVEKAEPVPSTGRRFAAIVNSPAFIWFMSSVVIAAVGQSYSEHQNERQERENASRVAQERETQRTDRILQLNVELGFRLRSNYLTPSVEDLVDLSGMLNGFADVKENKPVVTLGSLRDYRGLPIEPIYFERCMLKKLNCNPSFEDFAKAVSQFKRHMRKQMASSGSAVIPELNANGEPLLTLRTAFLDVRMDAETRVSVKTSSAALPADWSPPSHSEASAGE